MFQHVVVAGVLGALGPYCRCCEESGHTARASRGRGRLAAEQIISHLAVQQERRLQADMTGPFTVDIGNINNNKIGGKFSEGCTTLLPLSSRYSTTVANVNHTSGLWELSVSPSVLHSTDDPPAIVSLRAPSGMPAMDVTAFLGLVHVAGKNGGKAEGGMVSARVCGGERLQICVEARAQHGETILAQFQSETGLVLTHAELLTHESRAQGGGVTKAAESRAQGGGRPSAAAAPWRPQNINRAGKP